jgi:hypothetical protein
MANAQPTRAVVAEVRYFSCGKYGRSICREVELWAVTINGVQRLVPGVEDFLIFDDAPEEGTTVDVFLKQNPVRIRTQEGLNFERSAVPFIASALALQIAANIVLLRRKRKRETKQSLEILRGSSERLQ